MELTFTSRPVTTQEWVAYRDWKQFNNPHALVDLIYRRAVETVARDDLYALDINELYRLGTAAMHLMQVGDTLSVLSLAWERETNAAFDIPFSAVTDYFSAAIGLPVSGRDIIAFVEEKERQEAARAALDTPIRARSTEDGPVDVPVDRPPVGKDETLERWRRQLDHGEEQTDG
jgi:hypothetical protein